jgi:UDP-3-O-[3-hydroxymyristoyl] glucosamine N-acyltransferase
MKSTLKEIASRVNAQFTGDANIEIQGIKSLEEAKQGDIAFLFDSSQKEKIASSQCSCVVVAKEIDVEHNSVLKVENVQLAFKAIANQLGLDNIPCGQGIHSTAFLANSVKLGNNVVIGAYVIVEENVEIGDNTIIYPYTYIGHNTVIGKECRFFPNVSIREKCVIGNNVTIHSGSVIGSDGFGYEFDMKTGAFIKLPQIGNVVIQDQVEIGACVTIDRAKVASTIIGRGSKIDNLTQIAHNVKIGMNTVIAAQTGIAGSTEVGNFVMMGGQVGIRDHVKIGAKCGIVGDVAEGKTMLGQPGREAMKTARIIAVMEKLPELYKKFNKFEKMMDETENL